MFTSNQQTKSKDSNLPDISIVVPVFNEEKIIQQFVAEIEKAFGETLAKRCELVFVDDGSTDNTWNELNSINTLYAQVQIIRLSRNSGKENALLCGLSNARGQAHIPMDIDLQDPPNVVPLLVEKWELGHKTVLAKRISRTERFSKRLTASIYYRLIGYMSKGLISSEVGDFRLMDSSITQRYLSLPEKVRFNKGLFALVTSNPATIEYDRPAGIRDTKAKQSIPKLIELALSSVFSFSVWPLRALTIIGLLLLFLSILGSVLAVVLWATGILTVPGQTTLLLSIFYISGFQSLSLGIVGEYIGQLVIEIKRRPEYFIDEIDYK